MAIKNWALLTLVMGALFGGFIYWVHGDIEDQRISPAAISHGSALLGLFFASRRGPIGSTATSFFTATMASLWGRPTQTSMSNFRYCAARGAFIVGLWRMGKHVGAFLHASPRRVVLLFVDAVPAVGLVPALFQRFYVDRTNWSWEAPYLRTQHLPDPRGLQSSNRINSQAFPCGTGPELQITRGQPRDDRQYPAVGPEPLIDTFAQLQEIRTYYRFRDVDVDRYWTWRFLPAGDVFGAGAEAALLPPNAQTWVNRHLLFTHGNGQ